MCLKCKDIFYLCFETKCIEKKTKVPKHSLKDRLIAINHYVLSVSWIITPMTVCQVLRLVPNKNHPTAEFICRIIFSEFIILDKPNIIIEK